jgi:hypothetical protein
MALLLVATGALVIVDSLRVGIGWADDGPRAGYFPFYVGLALLGASLFIAGMELWRGAGRDKPFAEREQIAQVFAVLVPTCVYVAVIWGLGIYIASALLIGYFMRRHGKYAWGLTAGVALGVPIVFFLVFEKWFLVPLHKGPIERLLGF